MIQERFDLKGKKVLMVGDRPNTDIAFGNASGIDTCLVMTGVVKDEEDFNKNWATGQTQIPKYFMQSFGSLKRARL